MGNSLWPEERSSPAACERPMSPLSRHPPRAPHSHPLLLHAKHDTVFFFPDVSVSLPQQWPAGTRPPCVCFPSAGCHQECVFIVTNRTKLGKFPQENLTDTSLWFNFPTLLLVAWNVRRHEQESVLCFWVGIDFWLCDQGLLGALSQKRTNCFTVQKQRCCRLIVNTWLQSSHSEVQSVYVNISQMFLTVGFQAISCI